MATIKYKPRLGIICGSGLGNISDRITEKQIIDYESILEFPKKQGNLFICVAFIEAFLIKFLT